MECNLNESYMMGVVLIVEFLYDEIYARNRKEDCDVNTLITHIGS